MLDWAREVLADVGLQDGFGFDDLVAFCAGALTVLTLVTLIFRPLGKGLRDFLEDWAEFRVDWFGEPARDGRSSRPGVMSRLNNIDGEFQRNGGSTMKDSQYRTERAVQRIEQRLSVDDTYRAQVMDIAEQNQTAIADAMEAAGLDRPAFHPFPSPPAIIEARAKEG